MPLSDHEQRLFAEIEQSLAADDGRFAPAARPRGPKTASRASQVASVIAVLVGCGCIGVGLVTGIGLGTAIAAIGFLFLVAGCWLAIRAWRESGPGSA